MKKAGIYRVPDSDCQLAYDETALTNLDFDQFFCASKPDINPCEVRLFYVVF